MEEAIYDRSSLAERLKISLHGIDYLIEGGLPHIRIGKTIRFLWPEVEKWLKNNASSVSEFEAALLTGMTPESIHLLANRGFFPSQPQGRSYIYYPFELHARLRKLEPKNMIWSSTTSRVEYRVNKLRELEYYVDVQMCAVCKTHAASIICNICHRPICLACNEYLNNGKPLHLEPDRICFECAERMPFLKIWTTHRRNFKKDINIKRSENLRSPKQNS